MTYKARSQGLSSQMDSANTDGSQTSQGKFESLLNLSRFAEMKSVIDGVNEGVEKLLLRSDNEQTEQRLVRLESKVESIALEIKALRDCLKGHYPELQEEEEVSSLLIDSIHDDGMQDVQDYLIKKRARKLVEDIN